MHLLRVQVPDFRVLKNVDIRFEKELIPKVFPLGSQNGGGKSTLLQLIFVLLHCSTNPERLPFLKNFLNGFNLPEGVDKRVLAIIEIWDGEKSIELEFFACGSQFFNRILDFSNNKDQEILTLTTALSHLDSLNEQLTLIDEKGIKLNNTFKDLKSMDESNGVLLKALQLESRKKHEKIFRDLLSETGIPFSEEALHNSESLKHIKEGAMQCLTASYNNTNTEKNDLLEYVDKLRKCLNINNSELIVDFSSDNINEKESLICSFKNLDINNVKIFLGDLSNKIFLTAPSSQIFLFLPIEERKSLFMQISDNSKSNYYHDSLTYSKLILSGLFTYDFLAVDILIDSFKTARDKDFIEAIQNGEYGSNYKKLLNELNTLMTNKYVNISTDFSEITFKLDKSNGSIKLNPEDLSHGELKRLSIYMWLKHLNIEDSIVLMDEVDIALHPDWQYRIVDDLTEWAPSNQYILATHSYELCQALTPSHVKILEPKLTERRSEKL